MLWRSTKDLIVPGGKYRWRTRARMHTPWFLLNRFDWLFAKGRKDCGNHQWHNYENREEHCLHCEVGRRPIREEWKPENR